MNTIKNRMKTHWLRLMIPVMLSVSCLTYAGVTWEEMSVKTRGDQIEQLYNDGSEYKQRYVLKYLPLWFKTRGVAGLPAWVYSAVEDALYNGQDGLHIMEAVDLTRQYGLSEFYDRLITLYKQAHELHSPDADRQRGAV